MISHDVYMYMYMEDAQCLSWVPLKTSCDVIIDYHAGAYHNIIVCSCNDIHLVSRRDDVTFCEFLWKWHHDITPVIWCHIVWVFVKMTSNKHTYVIVFYYIVRVLPHNLLPPTTRPHVYFACYVWVDGWLRVCRKCRQFNGCYLQSK